MVWLRALGLPPPIAAMSSLENTQDKGKIKLYTCACQPVVSEPKRTTEGRKCNFGSLDGGMQVCFAWRFSQC